MTQETAIAESSAARYVAVTSRLVTLASVAAGVATLVALFGNLSWLPELITHFRMQLAAGSLLLMVLAAPLRMPRVALLAFGVMIVNLVPMGAYILPGSSDAQAAATSLRVASINVSMRNTDYAAIVELVRDEQPDIIGFSEANGKFIEALEALFSEYPYRILRPEDGAFGLALFSRLPLRELPESPYSEDGLQTAIVASLDAGGSASKVVLAHVRAPTTPSHANLRNRQLERLAAMFRESSEEGILLGDLNITPWSPFYRQLEAGTGLVNAARGRGYHGTWPTSPPILRIPIDHVLLTDGFRVSGLSTGPDVGSDHLPLLVDLSAARALQQ